ncbi:transmembrane protein [Globomyces pollinis-pini]|nr:transmembrane protein [Globomyces pollinis-pini]
MLSVTNTLLPTRFLLTISHILFVIMVSFTKDANVLASIPLGDLSNFQAVNSSIQAALGLTWIGFFIEMVGIFYGLSIFQKRLNTLYILAHASASICLSMFVSDIWVVGCYWYIFFFCSVIPILVDLVMLSRVVVLKYTN